MFAGRLIGFAALLFIMAAIAAAVAPDPKERTVQRPATNATTPVPPPPPSGETVESELPGENGQAVTVKARVGDVVDLVVRANAIDQVTIDELGILEPVDETSPVELNFIVDSPGTYEVLLEKEEKVVGRLVVEPRQAADGGSSEEPSSSGSEV